MNMINIIISLLISFGTLILASQLVAQIIRRRPALKPIEIKSRRDHRRRPY